MIWGIFTCLLCARESRTPVRNPVRCPKCKEHLRTDRARRFTAESYALMAQQARKTRLNQSLGGEKNGN